MSGMCNLLLLLYLNVEPLDPLPTLAFCSSPFSYHGCMRDSGPCIVVSRVSNCRKAGFRENTSHPNEGGDLHYIA
jgi:hypothetical protein